MSFQISGILGQNEGWKTEEGKQNEAQQILSCSRFFHIERFKKLNLRKQDVIP